MYKRKRIRDARFPVTNVPCKEFECDHSYHPFSYYVQGGNDPTGEQTDMTGKPSFDSVEDISSGARVDAFADPRTNFFDVVEQVGRDNAEKVSASINAGETPEK